MKGRTFEWPLIALRAIAAAVIKMRRHLTVVKSIRMICLCASTHLRRGHPRSEYAKPLRSHTRQTLGVGGLRRG